MARYSKKQKAALDALMKDDVYRHTMDIIKTEGLGSLTMDRIASAIGVSRGTLYNYFDDKGAVVDFVEDRTFGPMLEAIESIAASKLECELKLTSIANWIFSTIYDDRALVIALSPNKNSAKKLAKRNQAMRTISGIISEGIKSGSFKKLSPVVVSEVFVGSISGMIERMSLTGEFYRADAVVPTLMELFLGGLRQPA